MSNMKIIPYNRQYIDKNDLKEILKSSKSDIITTGNFTKKLEINIKNRKHKVERIYNLRNRGF